MSIPGVTSYRQACDMPFRVHWSAEQNVRPDESLSIRDSGDGQCIRVGDDLYVVSTGQQSRLLARLSVQSVTHDAFRSRIDLTVGGPRTAVFFTKAVMRLQSNSKKRVQVVLTGRRLS